MSLEHYARQLAIIEDARGEVLLDAARSAARVDWLLESAQQLLTPGEQLRLAELLVEGLRGEQAG